MQELAFTWVTRSGLSLAGQSLQSSVLDWPGMIPATRALSKGFCVITVGSFWITASSLAQNPQGSEFQVNSYTTDIQIKAAVATDSSGNFVVVWRSNGSEGSDTSSASIQGQRFGGPVPVELQRFSVE